MSPGALFQNMHLIIWKRFINAEWNTEKLKNLPEVLCCQLSLCHSKIRKTINKGKSSITSELANGPLSFPLQCLCCALSSFSFLLFLFPSASRLQLDLNYLELLGWLAQNQFIPTESRCYGFRVLKPSYVKQHESVMKTYVRNKQSSACRMLLVNVDQQVFGSKTYLSLFSSSTTFQLCEFE